MSADATCPTVTLILGSAGTIVWDCETADPSPSGVTWVWTELPGWWEPPSPQRASIAGPLAIGSTLQVESPTSARWSPREVTLIGHALTNGDSTAYVDALNTISKIGSTTVGPGYLIVDDHETDPLAAIVRLNGRPGTETQGAMASIKVTLPLIAHDPYRRVVGTNEPVI